MKKILHLFTLIFMMASCTHHQTAYEALHEILNAEYDAYVARYSDKDIPNSALVKTTRTGLNEMDSLSIIKMDTLFTKQDLDYIFQQANNTATLVLNAKLLKSKNILVSEKDVKDFWEQHKDDKDEIGQQYFEKRFGGGYTILHKPLFNVNHSIVILHMVHDCGYFCGHMQTLIYRRENGKWKLLKLINPGIT